MKVSCGRQVNGLARVVTPWPAACAQPRGHPGSPRRCSATTRRHWRHRRGRRTRTAGSSLDLLVPAGQATEPCWLRFALNHPGVRVRGVGVLVLGGKATLARGWTYRRSSQVGAADQMALHGGSEIALASSDFRCEAEAGAQITRPAYGACPRLFPKGPTMAQHDFDVYATALAPDEVEGDAFQLFTEYAQRAERYGIDGLLAFYNHQTLDPWVVAATILQHTKALTPLIGLQPYAMAPFTAAKIIWSLTRLHQRRIDVNLITGATKEELDQIDEHLDHDERFERATEYMAVVRALLSSDEPLVHDGRFYRYRALRMHSRLEPEILPRTFVAGSSPAGQRMAAAVADVAITHPEPVEQFAESFLGQGRGGLRIGIRVGLVARPTDDEAWSAARTLYAEDRVARLKTAMRKKSESDWIRRLAHLATEEGVYDGVYWTGAFRADKGNMPVLVGSYRKVADYLERYLVLGVSTVILGGGFGEEDFEHAAVVLADLRRRT
jgi:alkanesulfonate monooxygenase